MLLAFNNSTIAIGVTTLLVFPFPEQKFSSQVEECCGQGDIDKDFLHA